MKLIKKKIFTDTLSQPIDIYVDEYLEIIHADGGSLSINLPKFSQDVTTIFGEIYNSSDTYIEFNMPVHAIAKLGTVKESKLADLTNGVTPYRVKLLGGFQYTYSIFMNTVSFTPIAELPELTDPVKNLRIENGILCWDSNDANSSYIINIKKYTNSELERYTDGEKMIYDVESGNVNLLDVCDIPGNVVLNVVTRTPGGKDVYSENISFDIFGGIIKKPNLSFKNEPSCKVLGQSADTHSTIVIDVETFGGLREITITDAANNILSNYTVSNYTTSNLGGGSIVHENSYTISTTSTDLARIFFNIKSKSKNSRFLADSDVSDIELIHIPTTITTTLTDNNIATWNSINGVSTYRVFIDVDLGNYEYKLFYYDTQLTTVTVSDIRDQIGIPSDSGTLKYIFARALTFTDNTLNNCKNIYQKVASATFTTTS